MLKSENQLICISKMAAMGYLHIQDRRERSPVVNIHPIFEFFFHEHPLMDYPA